VENPLEPKNFRHLLGKLAEVSEIFDSKSAISQEFWKFQTVKSNVTVDHL